MVTRDTEVSILRACGWLGFLEMKVRVFQRFDLAAFLYVWFVLKVCFTKRSFSLSSFCFLGC